MPDEAPKNTNEAPSVPPPLPIDGQGKTPEVPPHRITDIPSTPTPEAETSDLEPVVEEHPVDNRRRWVTLISSTVLAILVSFGLIFGGRTLYRHFHKSGNQAQSGVQSNGSSNSVPSSPSTSASKSNKPSKSNKSAASTQNQTGSKSANGQKKTPQASKPPASSATAALPNSGPGDVIKIFILSTAAASLAHYLYISRRVRLDSTK